MKIPSFQSSKKGFTLVELIIVMAIIGILAAILIPTMMGYITSSQISGANSTASEIQKGINTFMLAIEREGYGMFKGGGNSAEFFIELSDGQWDVTGVYSSDHCFNTKGRAVWDGAGSGTYGDSKADAADDGEELLALTLAELYPDIENGYLWLLVEGGYCSAVCWTEDTNAKPADGVLPGKDNFDAEAFEWDGHTAGVTANGLIVGTSPVVPVGTSSGG